MRVFASNRLSTANGHRVRRYLEFNLHWQDPKYFLVGVMECSQGVSVGEVFTTPKVYA